MKTRLLLTTMLIAFSCQAALAQENDFLTDYSVLIEEDAYGNKALYVAPGALDRVAAYSKVMIDQPEIFLDPESKYKGMKPDTMTEIAETLRGAVKDGIDEQYEVVEEPGEGTLYARWAVTKMYLQKPKRRLVSFTPVGMVAHGVKSGVSEFVDKNTLVELTIEAEVMDSMTGDVLVAFIIQRGQREDKKQDIEEEPANWEQLVAIGNGLGRRLGCRLNNARLAESERDDCLAITIEVPEEEGE